MSIIHQTTTSIYPPLGASLEAVRPELAALETNDLLQLTIDPIVAVGTVRGAMPQIVKHRAALEKLPGFDTKLLDKLQTYASAALHANVLYHSASTPPEHFQELVARATELRDVFLSDISALVRRGFVDGKFMSELKGTTGFRNTASDLLTLVNVIRSSWEVIAGRTAFTEEELDNAEMVGNQLVGDIGVRQYSPAAVDGFARERQQAYTLLVNAYEEVRRGISFVRWHEGDVDQVAPSLFSGRRKRGTSSDETEEVENGGSPPAVTPATGTTPNATVPNATASVTATAASTAASKPAPGMPGADPFGP